VEARQVGHGDHAVLAGALAHPQVDPRDGGGERRAERGLVEPVLRLLDHRLGPRDGRLRLRQVGGARVADQLVQLGLGDLDAGLGGRQVAGTVRAGQLVQLRLGAGYLGPRRRQLLRLAAGALLVATLWLVGWLGYWLTWDERGKQVALGTARFLDALPVFADPLSRSFLADDTVNSLVFFIVFFNVYQGVREVPQVVLANARMLGMNDRQLMRHVYWPSALTWVFSSLHASVGFALVGAVVGEYLGSAAGLGYLIHEAEGVFDVTGVFAGMIVLAIFVIAIDWAVTLVENRLLVWRPQPHQQS